jgi:hypothetical protein
MPVKQDQEEREWIESHIPKSFRPEELECWRVFCARFGRKINREDLVGLARTFAQTIQAELPRGRPSPLRYELSRHFLRRKKCLLWWFQENWEIIEPWLQSRVVIHLNDGNTL